MPLLPLSQRGYLQVVLQVVDEEGHVVAQSPLHGGGLVGLQVLPLHLEGPAVLQLRLHPAHTQQVPEHNVVPEEGEGVHRLCSKQTHVLK